MGQTFSTMELIREFYLKFADISALEYELAQVHSPEKPMDFHSARDHRYDLYQDLNLNDPDSFAAKKSTLTSKKGNKQNIIEYDLYFNCVAAILIRYREDPILISQMDRGKIIATIDNYIDFFHKMHNFASVGNPDSRKKYFTSPVDGEKIEMYGAGSVLEVRTSIPSLNFTLNGNTIEFILFYPDQLQQIFRIPQFSVKYCKSFLSNTEHLFKKDEKVRDNFMRNFRSQHVAYNPDVKLDMYGFSFLDAAILHRNLDLVKLFLDFQNNNFLNRSCPHGFSSLHLLVGYDIDAQIMKRMNELTVCFKSEDDRMRITPNDISFRIECLREIVSSGQLTTEDKIAVDSYERNILQVALLSPLNNTTIITELLMNGIGGNPWEMGRDGKMNILLCLLENQTSNFQIRSEDQMVEILQAAVALHKPSEEVKRRRLPKMPGSTTIDVARKICVYEKVAQFLETNGFGDGEEEKKETAE